eukprot:1775562-Prymnesium_polylepis.1
MSFTLSASSAAVHAAGFTMPASCAIWPLTSTRASGRELPSTEYSIMRPSVANAQRVPSARDRGGGGSATGAPPQSICQQEISTIANATPAKGSAQTQQHRHRQQCRQRCGSVFCNIRGFGNLGRPSGTCGPRKPPTRRCGA